MSFHFASNEELAVLAVLDLANDATDHTGRGIDDSTTSQNSHFYNRFLFDPLVRVGSRPATHNFELIERRVITWR